MLFSSNSVLVSLKMVEFQICTVFLCAQRVFNVFCCSVTFHTVLFLLIIGLMLPG